MITKLQVTNFKNYTGLTAAFAPGINFFVGLNGVGKTNLLDAIHYLSVTKSFNTAQDKYNVRFDADFFRLEMDISRKGREHVVCAKVKPGSVKEILHDGKKIDKLGDHIGYMPVIILSPKDQTLITGASLDRRRFLDFYLSQIDSTYLADLVAYNRLLVQRNAVLKDRGWQADDELLMTYTSKMEGAAARIGQKRSDFVQALQPITEAMYQKISDGETPVLLEYLADSTPGSLSVDAQKSIDRDKALGRTTKGVHRDDLAFSLEAHSVKRFGSQGQVKTYLIALHLALRERLQQESGLKPIFLLDDIFDKLDDERVEQLVDTLGHADFGQVFITDARADRVAHVCMHLAHGARVFEITDGEVSNVIDYPESLELSNLQE